VEARKKMAFLKRLTIAADAHIRITTSRQAIQPAACDAGGALGVALAAVHIFKCTRMLRRDD
jgi:hypothetical protein